MKIFLAALALLLSALPAAGQAPVADPAAFVRQLYQTYRKGEAPEIEAVYNQRLRAIRAEMDKDAAGEVPRMNYDLLVDGQDFEIGAVKVTGDEVEGRPDRRIVVARFTNFGKPKTVRFYFEKTGAAWLLDEALLDRAAAGEPPESLALSLAMKYGG